MINPDVKQINTTALAYMGDAVYEVYIRKHVMETGHVHVDRLHAMAVPYVKAEGQAKAIKYLMDNILTEEEKAEQAVLRREYIDSYKRSLTGQLDNMYIIDEKGNKTKVERKTKKK